MPRADILDNPPDFTQEHVDFLKAAANQRMSQLRRTMGDDRELAADALNVVRGMDLMAATVQATIENRNGGRT